MMKLRGERKQDAAMDQAKFCGVAAAMIGSAVVGAGASAYSANKNAKAAEVGSNQSGAQSATSTNTLNPAMSQLLGLGGKGGLLGNVGSSMSNGSNLSGAANDFINGTAPQILNNGYWNTQQLNSSQFTAPTIQAAQTSAPSQNGVNLTPAFQNLLSGGNNSALRDSLAYGTSLTGAQFQKNQTDLTNNLQRNILPGIGSNAVLAGQYGGSRQGVAEGNAISDYTNQLTNANTQMGLANSANTTGQLANDYEQGQNRALSAAQGLSAQQYGVASQDAAARQAADNTNVNALLATRGQNSSNLATGTGLQQNLLNNAGALGNSDLTRLGQTAGILAPFLNAGSTTTSSGTSTGNNTQPLFQNTAGNIIGGAATGLGLYNQYKQGTTGTVNAGIGSSGAYSNNDWLSS